MAKILLIDDSESVRQLIRSRLVAAGHQVSAVASATAGLRVLKNTPTDLVITDIYMEDKDGLELIGEVRKGWPGLPLIAMSSNHGRADILHTARMLGASQVLNKPFSEQVLNRAVDTVLRRDSRSPARPRGQRRAAAVPAARISPHRPGRGLPANGVVPMIRPSARSWLLALMCAFAALLVSLGVESSALAAGGQTCASPTLRSRWSRPRTWTEGRSTCRNRSTGSR